MIKSKLTRKSRTTIPRSIRAALGLKPGDELAYAIWSREVVITKAFRDPHCADPFIRFSEWASSADRKNYARF